MRADRIVPARAWCLALVLVFTGAPVRVLAWGSEGHRIIAALAYERLSPATRRSIADLIAHAPEQATPDCLVRSIDDAATWPDCVRSDPRFRYLAPTHYEDLPICGPAVESVYCPGGRCVEDETERAIAILGDRRRRWVDRLQALEEVAHFIGDMHQPLHVADNGDRGGNEVHVEVEGHPSNLHHVWDDEVVVAAVGPSELVAVEALRPLVHAKAQEWSTGDPHAWVWETHALAKAYVYPRLAQPPACHAVGGAPQVIPGGYLAGAAPFVRAQLARAAVRLAIVLNHSLGS